MSKKDIPEVPFSLEKIIKGMPECAYVFSNDGKLLAWNKSVEILSEYSADELKNIFVSELIYKDDKERIVEKFMEMLAKGDDKERLIEYRVQVKSGKVIPVIAMRSLLVVDGNKYMVGILIDISKIKNNKDELNTHIAEINSVKTQLQDYYHGIEKLNQAEIELKDRLFVNAKEFSNKLINSLPGIFYVYEKVGDKFFLKRWNKNLESNLGYSGKELLNMQPYQFFTKKDYVKVEQAIMEIFTNGTTQIKAPIIYKDGRQVPYFYQAYIFEDKGKAYFMGIGLDMSVQDALERKHQRQEREKRKAQKILDENKRELVATALEISRTSNLENHTESGTEICNNLIHVKNDLKLQIKGQDNWEIFKLRFTEVHKDFFGRLKINYPTLTKSELKFCAYLRINLTSSQISSVLNISNEGIKKTRYRIRKKLNLMRKSSLEDYIAKF